MMLFGVASGGPEWMIFLVPILVLLVALQVGKRFIYKLRQKKIQKAKLWENAPKNDFFGNSMN